MKIPPLLKRRTKNTFIPVKLKVFFFLIKVCFYDGFWGKLGFLQYLISFSLFVRREEGRHSWLFDLKKHDIQRDQRRKRKNVIRRDKKRLPIPLQPSCIFTWVFFLFIINPWTSKGVQGREGISPPSEVFSQFWKGDLLRYAKTFSSCSFIPLKYFGLSTVCPLYVSMCLFDIAMATA